MHHTRYRTGCVPAAALCILSSATMAQTSSPAISPAPASTTASGEIVVTAQRRSENIQKVPLTVNAFSGAQIAQRGIVNLNDVAVQAPGLRFSEFANAGNVSIRGIGTAFVSGNGESSVALYLDGVIIPQSKALGLGQFDLGSIEVLRGPQGTLYGRNSTAGVINITSAAPTSKLTAGATIGFGNYADRKGSAYISGPLGDRIRARLYVEGERRDGYVTNVNTGQDLENLKAYGARLSVDADPVDGWQIQARATTRKERSAAPVFDSFDPDFPILSAFGLPGSITNSDFDPYKVNSPTRYSGSRRLDVISVKNIVSVADGINATATTGYTNSRFANTYDTLGSALPYPLVVLAKSNSFTQEVNLNGHSANFDWLVGGYFFRQHYTLDNLSSPPAGIGPVSPTNQSAIQKSISAFADVTYNVGTKTHIFGGARINQEKVKQILRIADETPAGEIVRCPLPGGNPEQKLKDTALTGRVGIRQDVNDDVNVYLQGSHGYKAPSFSQSSCDNQYKPETVNAAEFGFKSRFWDRRATLNVSIFYNSVKNLQLEIVSPLGIPVVNIPKSVSYGAEISLNLQPVKALRFDANLSLLHARYTSHFGGDADLSPDLVPQDVDGNRLNNAPDISGFVAAEYQIGLGSAGSLTPRAELNATTKYNLREVTYSYTVQKSYTTQNLFLTYRTENQKYSVRGYVKNLSNKAILGGILGFGGVLGSYLPPRTYGVELSAKF